MQRNTVLGIDVGVTNLGVGTFDGVTAGMCRVDLGQQEVAGVKIKQTPIQFISVAERFVEERRALLEQVCKAKIEIQMKSSMEQLGQALGAMIKGRHPHIDVDFTAPASVRAMCNTRILDRTIPKSIAYTYRKKLSIAVLPKVLAARDVQRVREMFGAKQDDPIEALLIAIHGFHNIAPRRRVVGTTTTAPSVLAMSAPVIFHDIREIALTPEERGAVLRDMPMTAVPKVRRPRASAAPVRKRARAAPPSP